MKTKSRRKTRVRPIPEFSSVEEESKFWDEHDITEYGDEPADDIQLAIEQETKKRVTIRLDVSLIEQLKKTAKSRNVGYQTLARGILKQHMAEMLTIGWLASPDHAARSQTVNRLHRLSERILERRGGQPLPDSTPFIRAERDRMADRGGP